MDAVPACADRARTMEQARVALLALGVVVLLVHGAARGAEAASYNVGNSAGWDLSADFPSWLNGKTFYVGDVLGTYEPNHGRSRVPPATFVVKMGLFSSRAR
jgi:hypothetical protein